MRERERESINKDVQQNPALLVPILTLGHTEVRVQGSTNVYGYISHPIIYKICSVASIAVGLCIRCNSRPNK